MSDGAVRVKKGVVADHESFGSGSLCEELLSVLSLDRLYLERVELTTLRAALWMPKVYAKISTYLSTTCCDLKSAGSL